MVWCGTRLDKAAPSGTEDTWVHNQVLRRVNENNGIVEFNVPLDTV